MKTYAAILFCGLVSLGAYAATGDWRAVAFAGIAEFAAACVVWAVEPERR